MKERRWIMTIVKIKVCASCLSTDIVDKNCICVWEKKYPTVELEFEQCDCCGNVSQFPIDNEFNYKQLRIIEESEEDNP